MIASKRAPAPKGVKQARRIYRFMIRYAMANDGLTPTTRTIEDQCGFSTNSAPAMYLQRLRGAGAVVVLAGGRRYKLAGSSWAGPEVGPGEARALGPLAYTVLDYMIQFKQQNAGMTPTTREIAPRIGISSSSIIHDAWQTLTLAGWLMPVSGAMGYAIKGGKWTPPPADTIEKFSGKAA